MTKQIPTHDPQTGELNPHYEELTGKVNPLSTINTQNFEPKRKNRWVVSIGDDEKINAWVIHKAIRPTFKKVKKFLFFSYYEPQEMNLSLRDLINPSTAQFLYELMINKKRFNITIQLLDPTGVAIEEWLIQDCEILEIDFGLLDYSNDGLLSCDLKIKPKRAKLLY